MPSFSWSSPVMHWTSTILELPIYTWAVQLKRQMTTNGWKWKKELCLHEDMTSNTVVIVLLRSATGLCSHFSPLMRFVICSMLVCYSKEIKNKFLHPYCATSVSASLKTRLHWLCVVADVVTRDARRRRARVHGSRLSLAPESSNKLYFVKFYTMLGPPL